MFSIESYVIDVVNFLKRLLDNKQQSKIFTLTFNEYESYYIPLLDVMIYFIPYFALLPNRETKFSKPNFYIDYPALLDKSVNLEVLDDKDNILTSAPVFKFSRLSILNPEISEFNISKNSFTFRNRPFNDFNYIIIPLMYISNYSEIFQFILLYNVHAMELELIDPTGIHVDMYVYQQILKLFDTHFKAWNIPLETKTYPYKSLCVKNNVLEIWKPTYCLDWTMYLTEEFLAHLDSNRGSLQHYLVDKINYNDSAEILERITLRRLRCVYEICKYAARNLNNNTSIKDIPGNVILDVFNKNFNIDYHFVAVDKLIF